MTDDAQLTDVREPDPDEEERPGGWLVDDPREDDQLETDTCTVRAQSDALVTSGRGDRDRAIARRVLNRRARGTDDPIVLDVEMYDAGRRRELVLVVRQELLVRAGLPEHVVAFISGALDGAAPEPVEGVDGLERFVHPGRAAAPDLVRLAAQVREMGHQASVSHITPLRVVMKGLGGPEPTAVRADHRLDAHLSGEATGPVVAVVDTGVTAAARDDGWLTGVRTPQEDCVDPLDVFPLGSTHLDPESGRKVPGNGRLDFGAGHGTFVAGVVQQVEPRARVRMYRAMDSEGLGSEVAVAQAMVRAARAGADVLNLSLGVQTVDDQPLLAVEVALEILADQHPDVVVVAAAGNYGDRRACFPAAQDRVVSVAGLTSDLRPARWTTRGHWVDCSTVGEGVVSTFVVGTEETFADPDDHDTWKGPDPWAVWSGTSFAAPQVCGAVARRMIEDEVGAPEALRSVLRSGRRAPDVGRVLTIMPGTA